MITITKINGKNLTINCELIETMEETPDTTITMTTGNKLIAQESIDELVSKVVRYKRELLN
ncbi:MAG: flagellar FlbD family protein [Clostridiales bacterium]|jgi:flagellar protein FlbD|nr:flagellar FlbD family protein [Clostridiales bacterium]